jgi:hypothetical protein
MGILKPPQWLLDVLPRAGRDFLEAGGWYLVLAFAAVLVLVAVGLALRIVGKMFSRKDAAPEAKLRENLAEYPPAPGKPGPRRLLVEGIPARVRLVVIAPMGKQATVSAEQAEQLLEHVVRGLGSLCQYDKPRVRVWPPQLSVEGFGNQFHRYTTRPEREGQPSHWVLAAGKARVGSSYILLGLALQTDENNSLPPMTLEPELWNEVLRIKG